MSGKQSEPQRIVGDFGGGSRSLGRYLTPAEQAEEELRAAEYEAEQARRIEKARAGLARLAGTVEDAGSIPLSADEPAEPFDWHRHPDTWTRDDFLRAVERDMAGPTAGSWPSDDHPQPGSKRSIARRVSMSPTALWRRWSTVRLPGEQWPSGKKGPSGPG